MGAMRQNAPFAPNLERYFQFSAQLPPRGLLVNSYGDGSRQRKLIRKAGSLASRKGRRNDKGEAPDRTCEGRRGSLGTQRAFGGRTPASDRHRKSDTKSFSLRPTPDGYRRGARVRRNPTKRVGGNLLSMAIDAAVRNIRLEGRRCIAT